MHWAVEELRERGQDADWLRALLDYLDDVAVLRSPTVQQRLGRDGSRTLRTGVMAFVILRVAEVQRTVENELTERERRAYDAAVEALRGEGCRAGGKRLAAAGSGDYPMCQRSLYGPWRMVTAYLRDRRILIVAVTKHTIVWADSVSLAFRCGWQFGRNVDSGRQEGRRGGRERRNHHHVPQATAPTTQLARAATGPTTLSAAARRDSCSLGAIQQDAGSEPNVTASPAPVRGPTKRATAGFCLSIIGASVARFINTSCGGAILRLGWLAFPMKGGSR